VEPATQTAGLPGGQPNIARPRPRSSLSLHGSSSPSIGAHIVTHRPISARDQTNKPRARAHGKAHNTHTRDLWSTTTANMHSATRPSGGAAHGTPARRTLLAYSSDCQPRLWAGLQNTAAAVSLAACMHAPPRRRRSAHRQRREGRKAINGRPQIGLAIKWGKRWVVRENDAHDSLWRRGLSRQRRVMTSASLLSIRLRRSAHDEGRRRVRLRLAQWLP